VPQYQYQGRNQNGAVVKGSAEADTLDQLKTNLRKNGVWVTEARIEPERRESFFKYQSNVIKPGDLILYTKQIGAMLSSGVSLLRSLETFSETAPPQFIPVVSKIIANVKEGKTYSSALAEFPKVFSPFYIGMVQVGEVGSLLGEMHLKVVSYLEQGSSLKGKILFAAFYPSMVLGATAMGVGIIMIYAFPKIADLYKKNKVALPFLSQAVLNISDFLVAYWIWLLLLFAMVLSLFLVFRIHRKPPLKGWLDQIVFKIPFYGKLYQQILLYRFAYNLALLLNSGVPLLKSFEVILSITNNQVMQGFLKELSTFIKEGGGMAAYLQRNKFFPPLFVSMIRTGEESGEFVKLVNDTSQYYESEVEKGLTKFIAVLEPVLIIIAAIIVVVVLLAFYLPMFQMFKTIQR
jgi:type II secretory pathway component PulF